MTKMNSKTMLKIMAGLLPAAPITGDFIDKSVDTEEISESDSSSDSKYADYDGPTMEEEVESHSGSVPALKGTETINVQVGDDFDPLAGVYAVDSSDGNITDNIEVTDNNVNTDKAGNYTVSYRVENSSGNWYEYTRQIQVSGAGSDAVPMVPPTEEQLSDEDSGDASDSESSSKITFLGLDDITVQQGEEFDPKEDVQIIDVDGSDITNKLYISGEVNTDQPGEYTIAYAVFDHFGDSHAKARTITVE